MSDAETIGLGDEAPPGRRSGKNMLGQMGDMVARNRFIAMAIIVVLVIIVAYFVARDKGWFGLGGAPSAKKSGKKGAPPADSESDPEADQLIKSINSAE